MPAKMTGGLVVLGGLLLMAGHGHAYSLLALARHGLRVLS